MNVAAILVLLSSTGGASDPHPRIVAAQNPQLVYDSAMSLYFAWAEKQGGSNPKPIRRDSEGLKAQEEALGLLDQFDVALQELNLLRTRTIESLSGVEHESLSPGAKRLNIARARMQLTALYAATVYVTSVASVLPHRNAPGVRRVATMAHSLARTCHDQQQNIAGTPKPALGNTAQKPNWEEFSSYEGAMRAFYTWAASHGGRAPKAAEYASAALLILRLSDQAVELVNEIRRLSAAGDLYMGSDLRTKHWLKLWALSFARDYVHLLSETLPVWDTPGAREAASLAYSLWATAHDEQKKIP